MIKWLKILLTGFLVSCFYFPVTYSFLPFANTKNLMGAIGIVCMGIVLIRRQEFSFHRDLLILLLLSIFVSIASLLSININQTPDMTYVTYIRSAIIWLSGAFAVCCFIWLTHKRVDVPLIINYLAWVCVFQCVMTLLIEFIPAVRLVVDANVAQGQDTLKDLGRMYGIGASLDVGGSRFAVVLIALAFLMEQNRKDRDRIPQFTLILAFIIITVVGNMIARTTLVGVIIGLAYIILMEIRNFGWHRFDEDYHSSLGSWLIILLVTIPLCVFFYNTSPQFQDMIRFGFEGFFSLAEEGHWSTDSTAKLETMFIWPDNLHTWIIGDGYFENQRNDPNYIGELSDRGFYMGTDVGYCRFIFYFGVVGLITISAVMIYAGIIALKAFPKQSHLFLLAILCNFIIWVKVSTDLFPFLALFAAYTFLVSDLALIREKDEREQRKDKKKKEATNPELR